MHVAGVLSTHPGYNVLGGATTQLGPMLVLECASAGVGRCAQHQGQLHAGTYEHADQWAARELAPPAIGPGTLDDDFAHRCAPLCHAQTHRRAGRLQERGLVLSYLECSSPALADPMLLQDMVVCRIGCCAESICHSGLVKVCS